MGLFGRTPRDPAENKQLATPRRTTSWGTRVTKADARREALRDGGYRGWVDSAGNRVSDDEHDRLLRDTSSG